MLLIRPELETGIHTLDLGETLIVFDRVVIIDTILHLYRCNMIISSTINLSNLDKAHIINMCNEHNIDLEVKE